MSEACCSVPGVPASPGVCPVSGRPGKGVDWLTVAALTRGPLPPRQEFWLCRDRDCGVVYFGADGARLGLQDLAVAPGFKNGGSDLVCYCFHHRRGDIGRELRDTGKTTVFEAIKEKVQAGDCACEVRNPSGKCCLGEVQDAIRELQAEEVAR